MGENVKIVIERDGKKTEWLVDRAVWSESVELFVPLQAFAEKAGWWTENVREPCEGFAVNLRNHAGVHAEVRLAEGMLHVGGIIVSTGGITVADRVRLVPVSAVAELLNAHYEWDPIGCTAYVSVPQFDGYADKWAIVPRKNTEAGDDGLQAGHEAIAGGTDEDEWHSGGVTEAFNRFTLKSASDSGARDAPEVALAYDSEQLYVRLQVCAEPGEKRAVQRGVHVIVATSAAPGSFFDCAVVIEDGGIRISPEWGPGIITVTDFAVETRKEVNEAGGSARSVWTAEIAVPFRALGQDSVEFGEEWRLNVLEYRIVDRHPAFRTWVPVRRSFAMDWAGDAQKPNTYRMRADITQEGRLGRLVFGGLKQSGGGESPEKAAVPWQPNDVRFEYGGFGKLGFSFRLPERMVSAEGLSLAWKTPSGLLAPLAEAKATYAGDRAFVELEHPPAVERGCYELELTLLPQAAAEENEILAAESEAGNAFRAVLSFDGESLIEAGLRSAAHRVTQPPVTKRQVPFVPASPEVERLLGLIPDRIGIHYAGDPTAPEIAPRIRFAWSEEQPSVIVSNHSGITFPHADYPETKVLTAMNRQGRTVEYPYHEDADGKRYFLSAHVWFRQREYVMAQVREVAESDPLGAARLLYRFAQVYRSYVPINDYPWNQYPVDADSGAPNTYWGGIWSFWYYMDLFAMNGMFEAYAAVKQTDAFDRLSAEAGENVGRAIVEDMFKPSAEYVCSFAIVNGNMDYLIWLGLAQLAKAIGEPDYMHEAVKRMDDYLRKTYLSDGFFHEVTLSYHDQSTEGCYRACEALVAWADPEGYLSPRTGGRLDYPDMAQRFPLLGKAAAHSQALVYPDGHVYPVNDTWADARKPAGASGALMLPAAGIARLSMDGGSGGEAQLYMAFTPKYVYGHNHYDPLGIALFACGQELLPDIGYTHTFHYYPAISAIGHNTVLVDGKDMDAQSGRSGGSLTLFAPLGSSLQVMRARQENAYPGIARYEREPWLIGLPAEAGGGCYVVDIFRVSGGNRHEYVLQGDANHDAEFQTAMPLLPYGERLLPEGVAAQEAATELETGSAEGHYPGYLYVKQVQRGVMQDSRYKLDLVTGEKSRSMAKLRIHGFSGNSPGELFLGRFPSVRMTRLAGKEMDTNAEALKHTLPKLVVRREGSELKSTFVTVMEPYTDESGPTVGIAELLNADEAGESGNVALAVGYGEYTDYVLRSNDWERPFKAGDLELRGKCGFIRTRNGVVERMTLIGGTLLRKDGSELTAERARVSGTVTGVLLTAEGASANALLTDSEVPQTCVGRYVIVTHPDQSTSGFRIEAVVTAEGYSTLVLGDADPGFQYDGEGSGGSRMTSYPFDAWSGVHRFEIDEVVEKVRV